MESPSKNAQKATIQHTVLAILVVGAMIASSLLYLNPKMTELDAAMMIPTGQRGEDWRAAFDTIRNTIFQDPQYKTFKKFGDWPVDVKTLKPGTNEPFVLPPPKEQASPQ